ncbi:MAG: hypothetical protein ACR2QH_01655 [Geminicoccaceae bacterium]
MADEPDNGSAEWAAEQAAGFIGLAWYRRTITEKGDGGELMLSLADAARSHISAEQWRALGEGD